MRCQRLDCNPIITPESSASIGDNINGPSIICVPAWIKNPLGRYYCYFAHHSGSFIRLAYADTIDGPWHIYEAGTLQLDQCPCVGHIASPDVHIDEAQQRIVMYYHGVEAVSGPSNFAGQRSYVACSDDGIHFTSSSPVLGAFYFRVFEHDQAFYSIAKSISKGGGGILQYSADGITPFEFGPEIIPNMRHAAVHKNGNYLDIFYTKGLEAPEVMYHAQMHLNGPWHTWQIQQEQVILKPEMDYEGAHEALIPSTWGCVHGPVNQLRDPGYFKDPATKKEYLFYAVAGECGLAIAEIMR